ncbi:DUF3987 domain-containing protein [Gordonia sp. L191]|uniref:DUF3987 domain-containing protein n=1 Tax=Gordonia sp. L191 TaxID=2982699 RepID=UPI0024C0B35B|nr:DUF3987 domain-containing protein [Gordonia sp. L191]WHU48671.1 DUF3987 domain-containing protein [Gordonia sp. L191]
MPPTTKDGRGSSNHAHHTADEYDYDENTTERSDLGDDGRAVWWPAQQWADEVDCAADEPIFDHLGIALWREVVSAFRDLTGEAPESGAVVGNLGVMPAAVASKHAARVLTREEVAAYAAAHGLDDPHVIAERMAHEGGLRAEEHRRKVRDLFSSAPLPLDVGRAAAFPFGALPSVLADMAKAVAEELDSDPALCAPMALGAVSAALCGRVDVLVNDGDWVECGVSYIVPVCDTGTGKSPVLAAMFTKPIADAERELVARWMDAPESTVDLTPPTSTSEPEPADDHESEEEGDKVTASVVGEPDPKGPRPSLTASDITPERLVMKMGAQGDRMAIADAEGEVFEILLGRYGDNPSLGVFLRAYNREPFSYERVKSGSVYLGQPALTICSATQVSEAMKVLSDSRLNSKGLVPRTEFSFPESNRSRWRRGERSSGAPVPSGVRSAYNALILDLVVEMWDSPLRTAELSPRAKSRMRRVTDEFKSRRFDDGGDLSGNHALDSWAAKSAGRVARRALHLHVAEHGPKGVGLLIEPETVDRAKEIEEWCIANAKQAFGIASTESTDKRKAPVKVDDALALVDFLARQHADAPHAPVRIRKLTETGPKRLRQASTRNDVIDLLIDLSYVVRTKDGKADALYLNPDAKELR